ncbi:hypothetical protein RP75_28560 [Agrobacterium arsenijevicii]|uniref:Uncharacterized protein n=1 Tax=Agrobacterium arsenijevicii TaxID=1585697 RepID=A0ABR5CYW8_9HYPH|nr:hypothetical protein RP75_28560 [Agrobacterium arsenijevicii]
MADMDHHPGAVDILDPQAADLADPEASGISCGQRYPRLQTGDGLKELHHLVRRQNNGELTWFARIRDPIRGIVLTERDPIEKSKSAYDLI